MSKRLFIVVIVKDKDGASVECHCDNLNHTKEIDADVCQEVDVPILP